ncbi:MAG TPA: DEAD/DEAH box helicase [Opitutaceae bacterium]|jgi:ATP-dependent RNA helicase RhlE|nr:DEAD/DEAH box helicase [Opitutaceae bacterium]
MHTDTDTSVTFASLSLSAPLQRALADKGYVRPSPIQAQAIPHLLQGRDLIGLAQTGTGKTAAFSLPLLDLLQRRPAAPQPRRCRVLVLTPTRELAIQIAESVEGYGRHLRVRCALVFGGVGEQPQIRALAAGPDIVVATPGRLLDLMQQGHLHLDRTEFFVLDEADRMLDMGFAPDVGRIVARLPKHRQSLLFSATMPSSIRDLANRLLTNPVTVEIAQAGTTADRIEQTVCFVDRPDKHRLLLHVLNRHAAGQRTLVFSRTKHGADKIARNLVRDGVRAAAIHGNKGQGARQRALGEFRDGIVPVLVATDIAARGIDVSEIGLVVNYDLPEEPEAYVHRIGRTARAGASGRAVAFCDREEHALLRDIQRLIRRPLTPDTDHPFAGRGAPPTVDHRPPASRSRTTPSAPNGHGGRPSFRHRHPSPLHRGGNPYRAR